MQEDTIIALSTPPGVGAIALIRLSGQQAIQWVSQVFKGKNLEETASHTAHFGSILSQAGEVIDEVVVTVFKAPRSFTTENVAEISCHASDYVIQQLIQLFIDKGARLALPGEFTQRAYLNGRMDLAQAEAVADLINADTEAAHRVAMQQMRGGYSQKIKELREDFIALAALLELELDFGEEEVEFANRDTLQSQTRNLKKALTQLKDSFSLGNAIKNGVPVVIVGKPNAGKSTLLNALLEEEKAIVSDIPGTTRDAIEDEKTIKGIKFRFVDTAGLRETEDQIEKIGVERTRAKMQTARVLVYLFDALTEKQPDVLAKAKELQADFPQAQLIVVANKLDEFARYDFFLTQDLVGCAISALEKKNLDQLSELLYQSVATESPSEVVVSNLRHYQSLQKSLQALSQVEASLHQGISTELIASDMRQVIHYLGEITGQVDTEDLLEFIFSKFCIGK